MNRRSFFLSLWLVLLALPVGLEVFGFFSHGEWDMLSEHVIPWLLSHPFVWWTTLIVYITAATLLCWHWWFQYRDRAIIVEEDEKGLF